MLTLPRKTFDIILSKVDNPKGKWNKLHPGTRNLKNFALPMILCNLAMEIEHIIRHENYLRNKRWILVFMKLWKFSIVPNLEVSLLKM